MAVKLREAADRATRSSLPGIDSIHRYVRDYEAGRHVPRDLYAELYSRAFGMTRQGLFGPENAQGAPGLDQGQILSQGYAKGLAGWLVITNVSDDAIARFEATARELAEIHAQRPPALLLGDVIDIHGQMQEILRSGKQRLRQTTALLRIDADILAHTSLLLGDLNHNDAAARMGGAALVYAGEAGVNRAMSFSVLAKTERWRQRYARSAELALKGFEISPPTSMRVLLACQEAHASALSGDLRRSYDALHRAENARNAETGTDSGVSAWSFPRPRQALFSAAVAIQAGDPGRALRFVSDADEAWAAGDPVVPGMWAQIRLVAAIAHVMNSDLDGAGMQFAAVRSLAPEFRMATITGYTAQMEARLRQRRFRQDAMAISLREQIRDFESAAKHAISSQAIT